MEAVERCLPTSDEYAVWASTQPEDVYSAKAVQYSLDDFPQEAITTLDGHCEAYLLTWWRGEWNEY